MALPLLFHRRTGEAGNPPLVILHGLLGASRNWQTVARELAPRFDVYSLDLRNHGLSFRDAEVGYPALAGDVLAWAEANGLGRIHLLGHSMGGKTAMRFAADHPDRLLSMTVVDIAPRRYGYHHRTEFAAMRALDPAALADRRTADEALAATVPDWAMRQFLLTNLSRRDDGTFAWDVNHLALEAGLSVICESPLAPDERYDGPTTFILGGKSDFVRPEDLPAIRAHFPKAVLAVLPEAGHNPHIDSRAAFVAKLVETLPH